MCIVFAEGVACCAWYVQRAFYVFHVQKGLCELYVQRALYVLCLFASR